MQRPYNRWTDREWERVEVIRRIASERGIDLADILEKKEGKRNAQQQN